MIKKTIRRLVAFSMLASLVFALLPAFEARAAAENGIVSISGIKEGDIVELYCICNYSEETQAYNWASAVSSWLHEENNVYRDLTPQKLIKLNDATIDNFCQILLISQKNDATGAASLNGKTFVARSEDNNTSLAPGYYILLPKGTDRIYELKWFVLKPGEDKTIDYGDGYTVPTISSSVVNKTTPNTLVGFSDEKYPLSYLGDQLVVTTDITLPHYNEMYSDGKTLFNLALIIPSGMDYVEGSLGVVIEETDDSQSTTAEATDTKGKTGTTTDSGAEPETATTTDNDTVSKTSSGADASAEPDTVADASAEPDTGAEPETGQEAGPQEPEEDISGKLPENYAKQQFENVKLYMDQEKKPLFFGKDGLFFEMDGSNLVGPVEEEEALLAYNSKHDTEYIFDPTVLVTIEELSAQGDTSEVTKGEAASEETNAEGTSEQTNAEETTEQTDVGETNQQVANLVEAADIIEEEVDKSNWLVTSEGNTILIVASAAVSEQDRLVASYKATKNDKTSDDGHYRFTTDLLYSVSPLDGNLRGCCLKDAIADSYGIRITACMGYADSYLKTPESIMDNNTRMIDDVFKLYVLTDIIPGDARNPEETSEGVSEEAIEETEASQEFEETVEVQGEEGQELETRLLYDKTQNNTYEYTLVKELACDGKGQVSLGGIKPAEYLIVQTEMSPGYTLSAMSLLIEEADWTNETAMEGNSLFDILWLDYKTVYLPATGGSGQELMKTIGALILLTLAMVFARRYRINLTN